MSDMKCPFCQQKMSKSENNMFFCGTYNCSLRYIEMPKKAVEDFAESHQDRLNDCKRICNLNEKLERTRKALDVAVDALKLFYSGQYTSQPDACGLKIDASCFAHTALAEITALTKGGDNE